MSLNVYLQSDLRSVFAPLHPRTAPADRPEAAFSCGRIDRQRISSKKHYVTCTDAQSKNRVYPETASRTGNRARNMEQSLGDNHLQSLPQSQKRSRVLLSCAPCRNSKLKCDRGQPCGQCARKSAPEACVYAPKPEKKKRQPKGMAARLKRLEGMVRNMMDGEEAGGPQDQQKDNSVSETPSVKGQVVQSNQGTTYIGATHCMAILEDVSAIIVAFKHHY